MSLINASTFKFKSELVFNDIVTFCENAVLLKDFAPKEIAILFYHIEPSDIKIIYEMSNPICECGSKLHKHDLINWNMDKKYPIFKYRYICPKCKKTIITPLEDIVKKGCNYTEDIRVMTMNLYSKEHISYANATRFLNETYNLSLSRQSIYNFNDKESEKYIAKKEEKIQEKLNEKNIEPTGFPGHDESFLTINGEKYAFLAMIDSNNQSIINDQIMPENEYRDFLETFIIYSQKDLSPYKDPNTPNPRHHLLLTDLKKDTLIGDGLKEYPIIAQKANMDFHPCGFHIIMNQRQPVWKTQKRLKQKKQRNQNKINKNKEKIQEYYEKYKGQSPAIRNKDPRRKQKNKVIKMEKENRRLKKENSKIQKEIDQYENYNERISEIFNQKTFKNAKLRYSILKNQIEHLPDEIAKFITKLGKDLDNTLSHIENENIPKTNNWLELFFKIVFPKKYRKRFKTTKGVKRFLRNGKIKWYENTVLKMEIIPDKNDIWSKLSQKYKKNKIMTPT